MDFLENIDKLTYKIQKNFDEGMTKLTFHNFNQRGGSLNPNSY